MQAIGWIGSALLALCGVPQAWESYRQGHSRGVTWAMLIMWLFGDLALLIYVVPKCDWPLIANYFLNIATVSVIIWYKCYERNK